MEFEIMNIDQLLTMLDETQTRVTRGVNKVLKESGEPLKEEISQRINRTDLDRIHAEDDVQMTNVKSENNGLNKYIEVGYGRATGWRMYFVEYGTYSRFKNEGGAKGVRPQHIIQKSTESQRSNVLKIQKEGLIRILKLRGTGGD